MKYFKHKRPDYSCGWIVNGHNITIKFTNGRPDGFMYVNREWLRCVSGGIVIEVSEAEFVLLF